MLFRLRCASPRQGDDPLIGIETANLLQHGNSAQLRHIEIQHHDIGTFSPKKLHPLPTTSGKDYIISLQMVECVEETSDALLVVDHEGALPRSTIKRLAAHKN
jgi:hypothetical protein